MPEARAGGRGWCDAASWHCHDRRKRGSRVCGLPSGRSTIRASSARSDTGQPGHHPEDARAACADTDACGGDSAPGRKMPHCVRNDRCWGVRNDRYLHVRNAGHWGIRNDNPSVISTNGRNPGCSAKREILSARPGTKSCPRYQGLNPACPTMGEIPAVRARGHGARRPCTPGRCLGRAVQRVKGVP